MSQIRGSKRIDLGKYVIANIRINNKNFEILVDPDTAWKVKKKIRQYEKEKEKELQKTYRLTVDDLLEITPVPMEQVIEGFMVFHDLKRGDHVSEDELQEAFGTDDIARITAEIILNGDLQLTKTQRDKFIQEKLKKLVDILVKNCVNPQTGKPHPPQRIERAIDEANINIDPFNPVEDQVGDIVREMKRIIPIKMEQVVMSLRIPAQFTGKGYNLINMFTSITEEKWKNDGTLECLVQFPSGIQAEFLDKINKLTHGRAQAKIVETKSA
ncbi:ribosome assembly factor SBDS [Candidatus Bathyarchaeota archaeon]|nr:ribosome assembly factor SBDS [Candidatus Bathyarchaeota archaeon]